MPRDSDDDNPRWELPVWDPSTEETTPRWTPRREVPRWQPRGDPAPAARTRGGSGRRTGSALPPVRREPPKRVSPLAAPFVWWAAHPWIVVWVLVFMAPGAALLLRVVDESEFEIAVRPLAWGLSALFVIALALAVVASARRSVTRLAFGTIAALAVLGVLLWLVTHVTLGRTACPARAGNDLGARRAAGALDARQAGDGGAAGWQQGQPDAAWRERTRAISLVDYQLVESGCWERVAPIDGTHTWHEFRVTVSEPERAMLLKTVVVHTAVGADGWKITAIEGPLP
jgi:hypothetical protein